MKISAYKHSKITEPIDDVKTTATLPKFYGFTKISDAQSNIKSPRQLPADIIICIIDRSAELANPDNDVIVWLGLIPAVNKSGKLLPQLPNIYYWNEKFWTEAVDDFDVPYVYRSKGVKYDCLYEVSASPNLIENLS